MLSTYILGFLRLLFESYRSIILILDQTEFTILAKNLTASTHSIVQSSFKLSKATCFSVQQISPDMPIPTASNSPMSTDNKLSKKRKAKAETPSSRAVPAPESPEPSKSEQGVNGVDDSAGDSQYVKDLNKYVQIQFKLQSSAKL